MKRLFVCLLGILLVFSLGACQKESDVEILTPEELEELIGDVGLGDVVDMDDFTEEQQQQISDTLKEDGYILQEGEGGETTLQPANPLDQDKLDQVVEDAVTQGGTNLGDYDEAQKEQIKDALEEEGMETTPSEDDENEVVVTPMPTFSDAELAALLSGWGITGNQDVLDYHREVDLSSYNKAQLDQIRAAIGLRGLEFVEEDGKTILKSSQFVFDEIKDNPYE